MSSADVAKFGYKALKKGKRVAIPGLQNKLLSQSVRFSPRRMVTLIVRKLNESG
jgi:short-subunit dehydrogenase